MNPNNLNRVFKTDYTLVSDARVFFQNLLEELGDFRLPQDASLIERIKKGKENFTREILETPSSFEFIDPGKFYSQLRKKMNPQDTLTVDIGNHELWAISCFPVFEKGTFLCPTNFSAMGFAIPAAIAAQLVRPQNRAVCCVGDGGFLMSGFEILTAIKHQLPVIFCIFNDGALGITKGLQERIFKRPAFVDLKNPDFAKLADAFGLGYVKMESDQDIASVLNQAWEQKGPVLIDIRVNYEKMSPFLKGMVKQRVWTTPWKEKLFVARRFIKRTLFPPIKHL